LAVWPTCVSFNVFAGK